ncbi:MAG: hypothetical protein RL026_2759 [Pseudomonadota bacterium]|jgi:Ca2+-binding RTX toxin-like protein
MTIAINLSTLDIDFIRAQLTLPGNMPLLAIDNTGIRDVQGTSNNVFNPTWGAADQFFPRLTVANYGQAQGTFTMGPQGQIVVDPTATAYSVRGVNLVDANPRLISNLVADQSVEALRELGLVTSNDATIAHAQAELAVQDDPLNLTGARISPLTGSVNPLPFSGFMTLVGQFFDHGLDFVHKGQDGMVLIPLLPGDPLYQEGSSFNFMMASRTNMVDGESVNTVSPFIDLSQSYGSQASHTAFLREYDASGATTGRLVSGGGDSISVLSGPLDGMATWWDIKQNAARIGITLHDINLNDIPAVRLNADGSVWLDASGKAWLVAKGTDGTTFYVQDSHIGSNTVVLQLDEETGQTIALSGATTPTLAAALADIKLETIGHAFLDDMAHGTGPNASNTNEVGDIISTLTKTEYMEDGVTIRYQGTVSDLVNQHFIAGDGRSNENIGLTAIHDVFHSEHNRILVDIKAMVLGGTDSKGVTWEARADAAQWTNEQFFQAAKLVTEMEYQHMIFGEFVRKFSPNIDAFAGYDVTLDASISAEFAHAVYRFGHSMLTETVDLREVTADGKAGADISILLFDAFLNPTAYAHDTAGQVALGMSQQVGYAIDEWVTDALRNNLVGLPLDLATLNMVRGRDAGAATLNQVRTELFQQTGLTTLKPYNSWDEFGLNLLHPESLKNFIMAYSRDAILTQFGVHPTIGGASLSDWSALQMSDPAAYAAALAAAAELALNDATYMTGGNADYQKIDLWLGGLAEQKVAGGMLGSTFDFIFATQMIKLQNGDRFYYLDRLAGTNLLAEIEGQLMSDLVMRNTGTKHLYSDIFSVPDAYVEISATTTTFATATQMANASRAGWYQGTFYGNSGNYLDARGVTSPNGRGNASEMIGGTDNAEAINSMGGNDTVWADGGNDTVEGGNGNDFLHGGEGNDVVADSQGDDLLWGDGGNDVVNGGVGVDQVFGGDGNDTVYGGSGGDVVDGGDGDDTMFGDTGALSNGVLDANGGDDVMAGGGGNDILFGGGGADGLDGGEGNDTLVGGGGADGMIGWDGDDLIVMDEGDTGFNNTIDGGLGFDVVDYSASKGQGTGPDGRVRGIDINLSNLGPAVAPVGVQIPDSFLAVESAIGSDFDDIIIGGPAVVTDQAGVPVFRTDAAGNPLPVIDPVTGQAVVDPLTGLPVFQNIPMNFTLSAGAGNDTLGGGPGDDVLEGGDGTDVVTYAAATAGVTVNLATLTAQNTVGAGIDTLSGIEGVVGTTFADNISGDAGSNYIDGGAGAVNDVLAGGAGVDTLSYASAGAGVTVTLGAANPQNTIGAGSDTVTGFENLVGSAFNDTLSGDGNANVLEGGLGNDVINGQGGTDTVSYSRATSSVVASLAVTTAQNTGGAGIDTITNVENLTGSGYGDRLTGSGGNNVIDGGAGMDNLVGGGGNDTIIGGAGNDTIDGGTGTDVFSLSGSRSDYSITSSRTGTRTFVFLTNKITGEVDQITGIEQLQFVDGLVGLPTVLTANADNYAGTAGNDFVFGGASNDTLNGAAGNDALEGDAGNDSLLGGDGDDTLAGGSGNDLINGGNGFDTAVFSGNLADYTVTTNTQTGVTTVVDNRVGGDGTDSVQLVESLRFADQSYSMPTYLTANADNYAGGAGDEVIYGLAGNDTISGGAGNDLMEGGEGNDSLNGGAGSDSMVGGLGNDVYVVDEAGDAVVEDAGAGTDTVNSSVSYSLAVNVENLTLTGTGAINGAGNALDNVITGNTGDNLLTGGLGNDTLVGGNGIDVALYAGLRSAYTVVVDTTTGNVTVTGAEGTDVLTGMEQIQFVDGVVTVPVMLTAAANNYAGTLGNDSVYGLAGNDTLNGSDGDDYLDGGAGADRLLGGNGNDTMVSDLGNDIITGGAGTDTVSYVGISNSVTVNLGTTAAQNTGGGGRDTITSTENVIGGSANDTLTGNTGNNVLEGGAGNDALNGGTGNDTLVGGAGTDILNGGTGLDTFVFDVDPTQAANRDSINGFVVADDTIQLSQAAFSALSALGTLDAGSFVLGTAAADADDRIIFNSASGALMYDADGSGAGVAVQFATLTGVTGTLTFADFVVIG